MAQFDFFLNRQGPRGPQGEQGEQGFSPVITVATNTLSEYILQIQTQNNTFQTANLREHKDDLGGTYIRYNRETGVMYAGEADVASQSQMGVVRFAAAADIERQANDCVVSPADVQDMISDIDPSGDISALTQRVSDVEEQADANTQAIFVNADAISDNKDEIDSLKDTVLALSQNKADRTDIPTVGSGLITINQGGVQKGSFNLNQTTDATINLDAGGGGGSAYTAGPGIDITNNVISVDSAVVALKSDLPNMNNYYNTTQVDLMLQDKADISEVPTKTSELTNDSNFITSSDLPTVGNGTITFTQGGVTKGTITTNQSGDATIALDAGGSQYILPPATTSTLGGVIPDGTTITVDADGTIHGASTYVLPTASSSTLGGVKVDGTTITIDSNGVISSSGGGGGTTYTEGPGIDINNDVISIDDTVVATKDDLDSKQDKLNPVAPINIQSIVTGSVYASSTGNEFTGTTITENLSLFSTTLTNSFDINADFSFERKNVTITAIPSTYNNIISVGAGVSTGDITLGIFFNSSGALGSDSNIGGSYHSATANISAGTYDFKICRESGVYKTQYKLSSSDTYIDLLNFSGSVSSSYYNKNVKIGATEGVVSDITDVKFVSQGTTLFERVYNQLSLSIGTGLAVQNGALTAPTPSNMVTTDTAQTISQTKTFTDVQQFDDGLNTHYINSQGGARILTLSQSGTDIATDALTTTRSGTAYNVIDSGNIGTYALTSATGVSSTNIRTITKLTQAQYDALATKDANTFYVIVAASSSS